MISGTVAWSSSGADLGFVTSAMTNRDSPASSLMVSVKSFVSGLSKLKTMGIALGALALLPRALLTLPRAGLLFETTRRLKPRRSPA